MAATLEVGEREGKMLGGGKDRVRGGLVRVRKGWGSWGVGRGGREICCGGRK